MSFTIRSNDLADVPARQSVWYDTDIAILVAGLSGCGVLTGCDVSAQGTPDMTVAVADGTVQPTAGGDAVTVSAGDVTIDTADATDPRIDLISVSDTGVKTVTTGTPAANPKPPDLPTGYVAVAMVDVPAASTAVASGQITDKRVIVFQSTGAAGMANPMAAAGDLIIQGAYGADLCLGATASSDRDYPANAIDGNDATYWTAGDQSGHWVAVDLGSPKTVAAFRVLEYDDSQHFVIQSSDDGGTYTTRHSIGFWTMDTGIVDLSSGPITARYWRWLSTSNSGGYCRIKTLSFIAPGTAARLAIASGPAFLGVSSGLPAWLTPLIRNAAGVPTGAPTGAELPIAVDTTSSPGDWYFWNGSAWVA